MKTAGSDPADVRATPRPAKFSLAANYDPALVPALAPYPVDEVYGKFPTDGVSGGRPRYLATPLSEADLRRCRVGGGIAPAAPHRPVRDQFSHPVRQ
jgi:hypothetical protein